MPSQAELAERYDVARMTIQQALRVLREENLIVSRQGSGVFVRERTARPVGLRPHIEAAFEQEQVKIDFSGYTAETLHNAIQEPLDKIREGRLTPRSIQVRLLLSDMTVPMAIPFRRRPRVRARMARTTQRYAGGIAESVAELAELQLVQTAGVAVRVHSSAPLFKLYLINERKLFWGFYPVIKHDVTIEGQPVPIFDPMGKDTELFHHTATTPRAAAASTCPSRPGGSTASGPPSPAPTSHDRRTGRRRRCRSRPGARRHLAAAAGLRRTRHLPVRRRPQPRGRRSDARAALPPGTDTPAELRDTPDPLVILRWTAQHTPHDLAAQASTAGEVAAAKVADLTGGVRELLQACAEVGRPVVIASNNAEAAIDTFLDRFELRHLVRAVFARIPGQPELMKPQPSVVHRALAHLDQPADRCVLLGHSITDVQVSRTTGTRCIGYAKTPTRGRELHLAGADAITDTNAALADLIRRSPATS